LYGTNGIDEIEKKRTTSVECVTDKKEEEK
jgi:hypothetical protein